MIHKEIVKSDKELYVILKYAKSNDGFLGKVNKQVWLTNQYSKRLVHKWRSEVHAILVGTNTAEIDNPMLTTRYGFGKSPVRIVLDRNLRLKNNLHLFDSSTPTIVLTSKKNSVNRKNIKFLTQSDWTAKGIIETLKSQGLQSLIIEGGKSTLETFIIENLWHEARIFTSPKILKSGIPAPKLTELPKQTYQLEEDILEIFTNTSSSG